MNVLLDTHAFLWFIGADKRLSATARSTIEDPDNSCFLSMASAWELSIKGSQGKITFGEPFESFLPEQLSLNGFDFFNITWQHVAQVHSLPLHHQDPFDRLIISQSLVDELPVITRDRDFPAYGVATIW